MKQLESYEQFLTDVKKGIVTDKGNCPVSKLHFMLNGITGAALSTSLKELESDDIILREQFEEIPPRVEYSLTAKGEKLMPIFYEMARWGLQYIE